MAGGGNFYGYGVNPRMWTDPLGLVPATSWNDFQKATKGWFGSRSEAATGWTVYRESSTSRQPLAIGRLPDTAAAETNLGMRRLNTTGWTLGVNDAWVQGGIDTNRPFYLASAPTKANRLNPPGSRFPTTVFDRELKQLDAAGYKKKKYMESC